MSVAASNPVSADATAAQPAPKRTASAHLWVCSTYFAEGFPYSIVNNLAEVLFKQMGASLQIIGLTSLFHLPWNLKFLWGPFVDRFETKRRWLLATEVALTILLLVLSLLVSPGRVLGVIAAMFALMAVLSATHDIAIDGFYLEGLDERGQSRFVGYRAMAYKLASLLVRGPLVILTGWLGWRGGILGAAAVMLALTALHAVVLPRVETRQHSAWNLVKAAVQPRILAAGALVAIVIAAVRALDLVGKLTARLPVVQRISIGGWIGIGLLAALVVLALMRNRIRARLTQGRSFYASAFVDFLERPRVGPVLAFVVLFRTGESFLQKMKWPFLNDHVHMTLEQYGFANGTLGVLASFAATFVGGWLISRHGLRRWIWPFVLSQNVLNLLYMGLAMVPAEQLGPTVVTSVIALENFGEGLGTAVFMVYLMRCCDPAHKAAHMAILTALMSVSFTLAGVASGFLASWLGFSTYFGFTFLATVPGMMLIPFIPHLDRRPANS